MNWYYVEEGQRTGPVTEESLLSLVLSGQINDETLVWREGMRDWQPYGTVKSSFSGQLPGPSQAASADSQEAAICVECGGSFPKSELISYEGATVCGNCKPAFFQKVMEGGGVVTGDLRYAGFWIRLVSYFLDFIVLVIASILVGFVIGFTIAADAVVLELVSSLVQIGIGIAYATFFVGKYGATPGKMAMGIKVVRPDGSGVSYSRAFARYLAQILSGLILGIGYIMIAFDSQKRGLHDHICDTRVIRE